MQSTLLLYFLERACINKRRKDSGKEMPTGSYNKTYQCELPGISPIMYDRFAEWEYLWELDRLKHLGRLLADNNANDAGGIGKKLLTFSTNVLSFLAKLLPRRQ